MIDIRFCTLQRKKTICREFPPNALSKKHPPASRLVGFVFLLVAMKLVPCATIFRHFSTKFRTEANDERVGNNEMMGWIVLVFPCGRSIFAMQNPTRNKGVIRPSSLTLVVTNPSYHIFFQPHGTWLHSLPLVSCHCHWRDFTGNTCGGFFFATCREIYSNSNSRSWLVSAIWGWTEYQTFPKLGVAWAVLVNAWILSPFWGKQRYPHHSPPFWRKSFVWRQQFGKASLAKKCFSLREFHQIHPNPIIPGPRKSRHSPERKLMTACCKSAPGGK